jgi:hypothetical protein
MKQKIQNLRSWITRYKKVLLPLSLVLGFVVDTLTLNRVDRAFENIVFIVYLFLALFGIFIFNYLREKENRNSFTERVYLISPFIIQFMFGGLFSGLAVFYLRSGSILSSWFFILILLVLMLGNDIFKKKYENFVLQINVFFIGLFFYLIFAIPILVNKISMQIFVLSGLLSLGIIFLILYLFAFSLREQIAKSKRSIFLHIILIFVFVNVLYFTNIIPPIPLSMTEGSAYNYVDKLSDGYHAIGEKDQGFLDFNKTVYIKAGEPVYAFSSVFAPADISIQIVHNWQYFNTKKNKWESVSKIPFTISGGRLTGYRGYSYKNNVEQGKWRVLVETKRGQVIGIISFRVFYTQFMPVLIEKVL